MEMFTSLYYQFLVIQVLTLWLWGAFNSNSAISDEVTDRTFDFFRMLPLTANAKTTGILVGKNLIMLLVAGCNFIFLILFGFMGRIHIMLQAQVIFVLSASAILTNSVGLLSSINLKSKKTKSGIIIFGGLTFLLGPAVISAIIGLYNTKNFEAVTGSFYGLKIPVLVLTGLILIYFICWSIKGTLRLFTHEDGPMFTRTGAYLFIIGYAIIIVGLFYSELANQDKNPPYPYYSITLNYICWFLMLLPALTIPLGSIYSYDDYLEFAGMYNSRSEKQLRLSRLFLQSNLFLGLGLCIIWTLVSLLTTYLAGLPIIEQLMTIGVILSFSIFVMLMLELYIVIAPYTSKIGLLVIFVIVGLTIFPLIFAGALDIKGLSPHSPLGYIVYISESSRREIKIDVRVLSANILLCIAPAVIIFRRYSNIIRARQKM
jgi:hypothetical protein